MSASERHDEYEDPPCNRPEVLDHPINTSRRPFSELPLQMHQMVAIAQTQPYEHLGPVPQHVRKRPRGKLPQRTVDRRPHRMHPILAIVQQPAENRRLADHRRPDNHPDLGDPPHDRQLPLLQHPELVSRRALHVQVMPGNQRKRQPQRRQKLHHIHVQRRQHVTPPQRLPRQAQHELCPQRRRQLPKLFRVVQPHAAMRRPHLQVVRLHLLPEVPRDVPRRRPHVNLLELLPHNLRPARLVIHHVDQARHRRNDVTEVEQADAHEQHRDQHLGDRLRRNVPKPDGRDDRHGKVHAGDVLRRGRRVDHVEGHAGIGDPGVLQTLDLGSKPPHAAQQVDEDQHREEHVEQKEGGRVHHAKDRARYRGHEKVHPRAPREQPGG